MEHTELVMSSELKLEREVGPAWRIKGHVRDFGILFLKK